MTNLIEDPPDMPPLAELGPPGRYRTPDAIQVLGVSLGGRTGPPQLHLLLEGGYELVVPMTPDAMQALFRAAKSHGAR